MPSQGKKRNARKKKQYRRTNKSTENKTVHIEKIQSNEQPRIKITKNLKQKPALNKNECLDLLEKVVNKLRVEDGTKLLGILEGIISIFNSDPQKRYARLLLISKVLSNVKKYGRGDLNDLKNRLNSVFFPKELKELMVNANDLVESTDLFTFLVLGCFGGLPVGYLRKGRRIKVTIKQANRSDDDICIIQEAKLLSQLNHENIIKILAFDKMKPRFAMEHMKLGNLSEALEEFNFSNDKLISILKDVTSGMMYLAEMDYVLRNLKSRNILLDAYGKCKISNFQYCQYVGDSDGIYIDQDDGYDSDFSAPEVRKSHQFSTKSDVWDMALVAWEIYYINPQHTFLSFFESKLMQYHILEVFIDSGELHKPDRFPIVLWAHFKLLLLNKNSDMRPTFVDIMKLLEKH